MTANSTEYISIIIPAYNSQDYLARCLDSVLAAADADCEIIVVNAGSTDRTLEIATAYEEKDARVVVISQEQKGSSVARKSGVEFCQGDSVIFVDSDDVLPRDAIAELRRLSGPDIDIVVGNMSMVRLDGTRYLSQSGPTRYLSGKEFAALVMETGRDFRLIGKKYARKLFDRVDWDTHPIFAGIFHRALLLGLACAADGKVVVSPAAHVYSHIARPWSQSSMLTLRPEGIARLWQSVSHLPLPENTLAVWGLHLLNNILIERGLPFDNDYGPAVDLRQMCNKLTLEPEEQRLLQLLRSEKKRLELARRNLIEGNLTVPAPHISFVIVSHNDSKEVTRTLESILRTGFRNVEIVIVDDGSDPEHSVELNRLAILYPRVILEKHPEKKGFAKSRLTGIKAASGYGLMFVDAGDAICGKGVLFALNQVDMGANIAFMGVSYPRWMGMTEYFFNPASCTPANDGARAAFESMATAGVLAPSVHGVIYNKQKLHDVASKLGPDIDHLRYKPLIILHMLKDYPRMAAIADKGYARRRGADTLNASLRTEHFFDIAFVVTRFLKKVEMADSGHLRGVASGVSALLAQSMAQRLIFPISGHKKAKKLAVNILNNPKVQQFYREADLPLPTIPDLMERAVAYYKRHRWAIMGMAITRI